MKENNLYFIGSLFLGINLLINEIIFFKNYKESLRITKEYNALLGRRHSFLEKVLYVGSQFTTTEPHYVKRINLYSYCIVIAFIANGLCELYFKQYLSAGIFLLMILEVVAGLFSKVRFNKVFVTYFFIQLSVLTFLHSGNGFPETFIDLYYIPILLATIFIFDFKTEKKYILIILGCIIIESIITFFTNHSLFYNEDIHEFIKIDQIKNFVNVGLFIILISYFIFEKQELYRRLHAEKEERDKEFQILKSRINDAFEEVVMLAKNNDERFTTRFMEVYPERTQKINTTFPNISDKDFKLCALLYFNFTNKEIAKYLSIEVKTVESQKYRLRKKYDIPAGKDIMEWMNDF
ncbi:helix-turn-helix transcriptional regulator [Chryseobacterium sp. PMSZPI]|uniref:helix-turn-helix transcriptional regulator n=1 Tax=Chryseobacterium sp. PMSZPI TaxID=1033900 RepID=UPI0039A1DAA3